MVGLASTALVAAMVPGAVSAGDHAVLFQKTTEKCLQGIAASPHWNADFNPSIVNRYLRENDCGRLLEVKAGWIPAVP
jgi:hypothetical protein